MDPEKNDETERETDFVCQGHVLSSQGGLLSSRQDFLIHQGLLYVLCLAVCFKAKFPIELLSSRLCNASTPA